MSWESNVTMVRQIFGSKYNGHYPQKLIFNGQLNPPSFIVEKMPMKIIAPRPDNERTSNSRYSFAYPNLEYQVPIVVLGGAYPFRFDIISRSGSANVAGATIGETRDYSTGREWYGTDNQKNYGVLKWTPDASDNNNTFSFTVRVTGQDDKVQDVTFSGQVDSSKFIFLDSNVTTSGLGTLSSPFKDNTDWYGGNDTDATYAGKFVYYASGTYSALNAPNGNMLNSNKPYVYMAMPNAVTRPVWNAPLRNYIFDNTGMDDFWCSGIYHNGTAGDNVVQCRYFMASTSTADLDRLILWNNYFYNGLNGSTANDNNAWLTILDSDNRKLYVAVIGNTFDLAEYSSNGFDCHTYFEVSESVTEHNVVKNYTSETTFQYKKDCSYFSMRANDIWENNDKGLKLTLPIRVGDELGGEICWNWVKSSEVAANGSAMYFNLSQYADPTTFYCYRNVLCQPSSDYAFRMLSDSLGESQQVLEVLNNVMVSSQDPFSFGSESAMSSEFTNGIFSGTVFYDASSQNQIDISTGALQNGGVNVRSTTGAEIYNA